MQRHTHEHAICYSIYAYSTYRILSQMHALTIYLMMSRWPGQDSPSLAPLFPEYSGSHLRGRFGACAQARAYTMHVCVLVCLCRTSYLLCETPYVLCCVCTCTCIKYTWMYAQTRRHHLSHHLSVHVYVCMYTPQLGRGLCMVWI
jgi:hypothetical protein